MKCATDSENIALAPSLNRGLTVQAAIAGSDRAVTTGVLASNLQTPRTSMGRIVRTLVERGYATQDKAGRLRPAFAAIQLAYAYIESLPIWPEASVALRELARQTGCAAQLMIQDRDHAVVAAQQIPDESGQSPFACRVGVRLSTFAPHWLAQTSEAMRGAGEAGAIQCFSSIDGENALDRHRCVILATEVETAASRRDRLLVGVIVYDAEALDLLTVARAVNATGTRLSGLSRKC
jgi:hypothetical protein